MAAFVAKLPPPPKTATEAEIRSVHRKPAPWWLPLSHVVLTLVLVAYFALYKPGGFWSTKQSSPSLDAIFHRPESSMTNLPFFVFFVALQIVLYSSQIMLDYVSLQTYTLVVY